MGDNHRNKRIKCVICAKEYSNKKFCCPKCKYPALSFSKKAAKQIARIEAYKQDSGYGAQVISKPEAIIQVDAQVTDTKPSLPDNTSEKKSVKDQPYYPFFVLSLFLAVGIGLMDGSFFDINVLNFYNDQYLGLHQQMECYMSYSGLAFIIMSFLYSKSRKLIGTILMLIMISCEGFDIVDSIAVYHLQDGAIIWIVLEQMFILGPIIWTIALLIQDMFAPSKQTL